MIIKARFLPWYLSFKGLLGRKAEPLFFHTRFGIHTFGLPYPIDVLILDDNGIIKKTKHLLPSRFFFWNPIFSTVIELPTGTIAAKKLAIGQRITLRRF